MSFGNVVDILVGVLVPLCIALLTVYVDRTLRERKDRKMMISGLLSEAQRNILTIVALRGLIGKIKESLEKGWWVTTPILRLNEESFKFAESQGLILRLETSLHDALINAYLTIASINQIVAHIELMSSFYTRGELMAKDLRAHLNLIEKRLNGLEPTLKLCKESLESEL